MGKLIYGGLARSYPVVIGSLLCILPAATALGMLLRTRNSGVNKPTVFSLVGNGTLYE